ncbi:MAG: hypothetical protein U0T69_10780 [Chitinophagales bacterium]|mgnify:CR=1 FL=1
MQIRGKIFTIIGIVLLFGFLIKDSLKAPYDPTQVVLIGNDTLGRDWGALAEQLAREQMLQQASSNIQESYGTGTSTMYYGVDSNGVYSANSMQQDPFTRQKLNQDDYSSIESPDGREIITGYNRPEDQQEEEDQTSNRRFRTRHQREIGEPEMKYRD